MTVLILAPHDDDHAIAVGAEITRLGGSYMVVDVAAFPERASIAMQFDCCSGCRKFSMAIDDEHLDLADVDAVWWRRPRWPVIAEGMARPTHRAFAANEVQEALGGLWHSLDAHWVNNPSADDRAQRKGYQLSVAQRLGFEVPRTMMTNNPDDALRFVDARGYRDVVYKSFSSTNDEWRETRLLKSEEVELLHHVRHAPVIFQEYIPAAYDLRITVVGRGVFAAAIHSQETAYPVDSRIDICNAKVEAVDLPGDIHDRLLNLTSTLGLEYGAVDMRLTPDGRYVFLEINPAGQFLYIEAATGLPIASAMAHNLMAVDTEKSP